MAKVVKKSTVAKSDQPKQPRKRSSAVIGRLSVTFFTRGASQRTAGKVYCILRDGKQSLTPFTTREMCKKGELDSLNAVILNNINATERLQNLKLKLLAEYHRFEIAGREMDLLTIKNRALGIKDSQAPDLAELLEMHVEKAFQQWKTGQLEKTTYEKRRAYRKNILTFFKARYKMATPPLRMVKPATATDMLHFLKTDLKFCQNYALHNVQWLKSVMNYAYQQEWIERNPLALFRGTKEKNKITYLTETEINALESLPLLDRSLALIRDLFIFQCYTGLSYADLQALRPCDIIHETNGRHWVRKERQKTGVESTSLLIPKTLALLEKYADNPLCSIEGLCFPVPTNKHYNVLLKVIQQLISTPRQLTTHLARRTYATLLRNKGVSLESVSKSLGHTNVGMTQRHYAVTSPKTVLDEIHKALTA